MTEPTERDASSVSAAQLDRVAQIRAQRDGARSTAPTAAMPLMAPQSNPMAGPTASREGGAPLAAKAPRRRHAAQGSRIVAAGLGATGMLGIVTVFGLDSAATVADAPPPTQPVVQPLTPVEAPPVQVVIHRIPATTDPAVDAAAVDPAAVADVVAPQPVQLTANPVVQTVTVAGPSQPRSSGSSAPAAPSPAPSAPAPAPAPAATTSGSG